MDEQHFEDSKALKATTKKRREKLVQESPDKEKECSKFFNSEDEHAHDLEVNNIEIGSEEIMDMKPSKSKPNKHKKSKNSDSGPRGQTPIDFSKKQQNMTAEIEN